MSIAMRVIPTRIDPISGPQTADNATYTVYRGILSKLRNDPELTDIIVWAKKKMQSERKIEELAKQYPAVKDAKEKLDIIVKLVQDEKL
jgi:Flp pilus assembly CpaF family ATPase